MAQPTQPKSQSIITKPQPTQPTQTTPPKKQLPAHYELTIEGTAFINGEEKDYTVTVKVPDLGEGKGDGHYMTFVLSEENGEILVKAIRKQYHNCEALRTHYLIDRVYVSADGESFKQTALSVASHEERLTIETMRKAELLEYIKERKYNIDTNIYKRTDKIKDAIHAYETDKEAFLVKQDEDREKLRIKEEAKLLNE